MRDDKGIRGIEEFLSTHRNLNQFLEDSGHWYAGNDPVVRSVVTGALEQLGLSVLANQSTETVQQVADKVFELLEATSDWPDVRRAGGAEYYDEKAGEWKDSGNPPDIDAVDHIMMVHYVRPWLDLGIKLEDALMLLTLHEAKAGRLGVALKAFFVGRSQPAKRGYRKWIKILGGRRKGGKKSGAAKREENEERDRRIRGEAVKRLQGGEDRVKIIQDLSERFLIGKRRVQQILSAHPDWPNRSRKSKRKDT